MSDKEIIDMLKDSITRFESKLDKINSELQEYKSNFQINLTNLTNKVDIHDTKLQTLDKFFNKSLKDRIIDKIIDGSLSGFSACVGVFLFVIIFKSTGSNIFNIIKPLLSGILG